MVWQALRSAVQDHSLLQMAQVGIRIQDGPVWVRVLCSGSGYSTVLHHILHSPLAMWKDTLLCERFECLEQEVRALFAPFSVLRLSLMRFEGGCMKMTG